MSSTPETTMNSRVSLNFMDTELTLGLPGGSREIEVKTSSKRGRRIVDHLNLGCDEQTEVSSTGKPSSPEAQVVGWPPVRSSRRTKTSKSTHVKVALDGAPYLRKVDLEMYNSYQQLLSALDEMFTCFTISNGLNESKLMNSVDGTEYVPTYEDKDGDWMLVGDVPWKMFIESCKRLRLMKSSEAVGLASRTPSKCTSSIP